MTEFKVIETPRLFRILSLIVQQMDEEVIEQGNKDRWQKRRPGGAELGLGNWEHAWELAQWWSTSGCGSDSWLEDGVSVAKRENPGDGASSRAQGLQWGGEEDTFRLFVLSLWWPSSVQEQVYGGHLETRLQLQRGILASNLSVSLCVYTSENVFKNHSYLDVEPWPWYHQIE